MRVLSALFLLVFVGALAYFAYLNNEQVKLNLFGQSEQMVSIPLLAGAVYLLGMFTGWAVVGVLKRSWTRATEPDRQ